MKSNRNVKRNIISLMLIFVYLALWLTIRVMEGTNYVIDINGKVMPVSIFSGVIQALQIMVCILFVGMDYVTGIWVSIILMSITLVSNVFTVVVGGMVAPIPGIFNLFIFLICLLYIYKQISQRAKDSITDDLTGLSNRRGFAANIVKWIGGRDSFSIMYMDLDRFKFINDELGHKYGDEALVEISDRIRRVVGKDSIVCRMGGDEFVIAVPMSSNPEKLARTLIEEIGKELTLIVDQDGTDEANYHLSAFIGVANYPTHSESWQELVKYADIAMYTAAKDGVKRICFFDEQLKKDYDREVEVQNIVEEALEKENFYIVYQPQFRSRSKRLRGFEALLRLRTEDGDNISPGTFIPIAEKSDLILKIDEYVLERVMREFKEPLEKAMKKVEKEEDKPVVSINVSAKNIANPKFADTVKRMIKEIDFPAACLEIEITEYCLLQSLDDTISNIKELRDFGVKIALDDFGTGYSSLSYLSKLPINLLKIDKSMIDKIQLDKKDEDFVNAIISLGHLMDCEVISEGVETQEQLEILKCINCDFIQGYLWGKPMDYMVAVGLLP